MTSSEAGPALIASWSPIARNEPVKLEVRHAPGSDWISGPSQDVQLEAEEALCQIYLCCRGMGLQLLLILLVAPSSRLACLRLVASPTGVFNQASTIALLPS